MKKILITLPIILFTSAVSLAAKDKRAVNSKACSASVKLNIDTTHSVKINEQVKKKEEGTFIDILKILLWRIE